MVNNETTPSTSARVETSSSRASETTAGTSGTTQQTNIGQDNEPTFAEEAVKQIEPIIESFRTGKVKKSQATYQIGQVLAAEPTGNEQLKSDALEQYANTLDRIESIITSVNQHGTRVTTGIERRNEESNKRSRGHAELDRNNTHEQREDDVDNFLTRLSKGVKPGMDEDTQREGSEENSDQELDEVPGERGRSNKKQKIYESQMPWFNTEQRIRKSNTNISCNKTRDIIEIFQRDPVTVKRWIRCATSAPAGFPNSEWDALVKGESVDLDTVFSSLHHV
jgi:hypothetical protein